MKALTEKQMHTRLNNYYKAHYGENDNDGFYVNPDINNEEKKNFNIYYRTADNE